MESEEQPTDDDLVGKNGAYTQSIAILHKGLNDMSRALSEIQVTSGNGMSVIGEFPSFVASADQGRPGRTTQLPKLNYQLQPKFGAETIRFVPNTVWAYGAIGEEFEWMPTISGTPISDDPPPTLPVVSTGAILYFKHTFTWNGDGTLTTESVEIEQSDFSTPVSNLFQVSTGFGTSPQTGNVSYLMFSAYNQNRVVVADLIGEYWAGYFDTPLRSVRQAATPNLPCPSATFAF